MKYIASCSFGKDSLAMVLMLIERGLPLDEVVFYDTGMEFQAIYDLRDDMLPIFQQHGIKYTTLYPDNPFLYDMLERPVKGRERRGYGWCGGLCRWGTTCKLRTIDQYAERQGAKVYVGIAADETPRLQKERKPYKLFPLAEFGMTEADCLQYCYSAGYFWLEGSIRLYDILDRVSCWCCCNKNLKELKNIRQYSPAALLAELKAKPPQFDTTVCEATLYNYIYRGDVFLVLNPEHLHEKGRRHYGEKYGEQRNAARAAKGPRIDKRDPIINSRTTFGHWEMDSVMGTVGSSRALVVLTERLTRAGIILPVPDHTAASVVRALNGLERRLGKDFYPMFQSITVDNGCEFQDYDGMEKACRRKGKRTTVYYCHPHAPHERGSNENMNRIIRRFFPKGTNFDEVPISEIRRAEEWMNNYPREVLGWQTAATLLRSYMSAC